MKKKSVVLILIIFSIICSLLIYGFAVKSNNIQIKIDNAFNVEMMYVREGFFHNYNQMSEEQKTFNNIELSSNLKAAYYLASISSYNKKNNCLQSALNFLYLCMVNNSTNINVIKEIDKVSKYADDICTNPNNIESARKLLTIATNILNNKK